MAPEHVPQLVADDELPGELGGLHPPLTYAFAGLQGAGLVHRRRVRADHGGAVPADELGRS